MDRLHTQIHMHIHIHIHMHMYMHMHMHTNTHTHVRTLSRTQAYGRYARAHPHVRTWRWFVAQRLQLVGTIDHSHGRLVQHQLDPSVYVCRQTGSGFGWVVVVGRG